MREPIPAWCFALTVVRSGGRYLLVREPDHGNTWYLPGGLVEVGETPPETAIRETLEEAGLRIQLDGVFRIEFSPHSSPAARLRFFFLGSPAEPVQEPPAGQCEPNLAWVRSEEVRSFDLRHPEVADAIHSVASRCPVAPIGLITTEGQPFARGTAGER